MNRSNRKISDKCYECEIFWANNDTETECEGNEEPCHEFRRSRFIVKGAVKDESHPQESNHGR